MWVNYNSFQQHKISWKSEIEGYPPNATLSRKHGLNQALLGDDGGSKIPMFLRGVVASRGGPLDFQ